MPRIETCPRLPPAIRDHLVERMRDRNIGIDDLNHLRVWMESKPEVPEDHGTKTSAHLSFAAKAAAKNVSVAGPSSSRPEALGDRLP